MGPDQIRRVRVLEVLEVIGTPAAVEAIADLVAREPHPYLHNVASRALERLAQKKKASK